MSSTQSTRPTNQTTDLAPSDAPLPSSAAYSATHAPGGTGHILTTRFRNSPCTRISNSSYQVETRHRLLSLEKNLTDESARGDPFEDDEPESEVYDTQRVRARNLRNKEGVRVDDSTEGEEAPSQFTAHPLGDPPHLWEPLSETSVRGDHRPYLWEEPSDIPLRDPIATFRAAHPSSRRIPLRYPLRAEHRSTNDRLDPGNILRATRSRPPRMKGNFQHIGNRDRARENPEFHSTIANHVRVPESCEREFRAILQRRRRGLADRRRRANPLRQGGVRDGSTDSEATFLSDSPPSRTREWDIGYARGWKNGAESASFWPLVGNYISRVGFRRLILGLAYLVYAYLSESRLDGAFLAVLGFDMLWRD